MRVRVVEAKMISLTEKKKNFNAYKYVCINLQNIKIVKNLPVEPLFKSKEKSHYITFFGR